MAERTGAALLVAPLLSTVVAASALMLSTDEDLKSAYLPALASGEQIGTLALAEQSGSWDISATDTTVEIGTDGQSRLSGVKMYVVDGQRADIFIVSARSALGSVGLYVVEANSPEVTVTPLSTLDMTRPQARVEFASAPARPLTDDAAVIDRVMATAAIMLAAEQVGGAQRCLDMAVEYAKIRVQFGRPIGSFQAIKHKCADMLLDVESARSAAYYAASVLDDDSENPLIAAALAKAHCSPPTPGWPRRTSKSTAVSDSPGNIPRISTSNVRRRQRFSSVIPHGNANDWPRSSVSSSVRSRDR